MRFNGVAGDAQGVDAKESGRWADVGASVESLGGIAESRGRPSGAI